jgi:predicted Zn-dependent peptidase
VTPAELERAKTGLKASTIMQGESTSARAGAIAHDFFIRGRIRTLDEIKDAIDAVTVDKVNATEDPRRRAVHDRDREGRRS